MADRRGPPPGWYQDPDDPKAERYWTGTEWQDDEQYDDAEIEPGWYSDPDEDPDSPTLLRWFDGEEWTDRYKSAPTKRKFPVWARVLVGVVGVLAGLALLGVINTDELVHRVKGEDPYTSISQWVQASLQDKLDTEPETAGRQLRVISVEVIHSTGNEYKGVATVRTRRGAEHELFLNITSDGDRGVWSAANPAAFLLLMQE